MPHRKERVEPAVTPESPLLECAGKLLAVKCWGCRCGLSTNLLVELSDFSKGMGCPGQMGDRFVLSGPDHPEQ